jgi:hypothetical protein
MCAEVAGRNIDWRLGGSVEELTANRLNQPAVVCARVDNSALASSVLSSAGDGASSVREKLKAARRRVSCGDSQKR